LVYWLKNETALICVNADSGEEVFCTPTRPWLYTLPFFTKGSIIFGTSGANGFLTNMNAASGDLKWSMPLKNGCAYFAMHGETVIVGDFDKKLYQIDLQSGEVLQELYAGGEVVGNIASENGFIYTVIWGNESEPVKLIKVKII
jgi:outer membrane protein assembly factor BamB